MSLIVLVLLVAAALCFLFATFGVVSRINLIALGLLFWVLTVLIGQIT
jgi:hypothetical protein